MKPGELVMTKRDAPAPLVDDNGDVIGIEGGTPTLIIDTHDKVRNIQDEPLLRVLINGVVGTLWPRELEELDETR